MSWYTAIWLCYIIIITIIINLLYLIITIIINSNYFFSFYLIIFITLIFYHLYLMYKVCNLYILFYYFIFFLHIFIYLRFYKLPAHSCKHFLYLKSNFLADTSFCIKKNTHTKTDAARRPRIKVNWTTWDADTHFYISRYDSRYTVILCGCYIIIITNNI